MVIDASKPAPPRPAVLINALSVGGGGNRTVARELARHLALARPAWRIVILLTAGRDLHESFRGDGYPPNVRLHFAPAETAGRWRRRAWERTGLRALCDSLGVGAVIQINGIRVPGLDRPTLAHFGDPWPYLPEAWDQWYDPALALARRRAHRRSLRQAEAVGFTSEWLRRLICGRHGIDPPVGEVFYNGVPPAWIARAAEALPPWRDRPMRLVSVSNVARYKGQERVIDVMPRLLERPGLADLTYHVAGHCEEPYRRALEGRIEALGLRGRVILEGRVSDARVEELLRTSRAYVLPSLSESFGIGAIEAMSFGCPVVAARAAAVPEVCGEAAELVEPGDAAALAAAIERVLTDEARAESLRQLGARNVARFNWSETAERMSRRLERLQ